ncbi:MAG: hypothetical protein V1729_03705, partial [Candidatus Woesearchaeota archaeon]
MVKLKSFFGKQGQLTLFMLIGIFLIGMFAFMQYEAQRSLEADFQGPTEKLITDLLKTGSIPVYVEACLENISEEATLLVGQQGGDIYMSQGGTAPEPTKFLPLSHRVRYGIEAPFLVNGTYYPFPPAYPGGELHNLQAPVLNFQNWGRFGELTLRKLCDTQGANSPLAFTKYGYSAAAITSPICVNNMYGDVLSSQWQMEQYIQGKLGNCTNWTAINLITGYNISAIGDPNVTVRLGLADIYIDAFIPLELRVGGREPIYTIGDFHTRLPVRLKRIAELASFLAMYDSYMLDFNLSDSRDYKISDLWDTFLNISVHTPMKAAGVWDDVISIEDAGSHLNGKSYVYRFIRENRYPTLDFITSYNNMSDYDYVKMENDTIIIGPNPSPRKVGSNEMDVIYDPDEDNLTYYYTGWKETCDEQFDFGYGQPKTACSKLEPTHPSLYFNFPNKGVKVKTSILISPANPTIYWKSLLSYLLTPAIMGDPLYPPEAPLAWTSSDPYKNNSRNASYIPNHDDIGPHNVTVWVCDEAGLCDYQIIRMLVIDFPELHLNGTNPYTELDPHIPHDAASVEDFYRLSGEGSTGYIIFDLGLVSGYMFSDAIEPFEIPTNPDLPVLDLPQVDLGYERDIRYIYNFTFNSDNLCTTTPPCDNVDKYNHVDHIINLSVTNVNVPPKSMTVSVYQCLPFRNPDPTMQDPWPYNSTPEAYIMSHTCC